MQPVGDLDEDHADVLGHGHEHLADVLHLLVLDAGVLHARELGDALDDVGHGGAELAGDVRVRQRGVLDNVMQQRRDDGILVQTHVDGDIRRRDAVRHVGGTSVLAQLSLVRAARHLIGGAYARKVHVRAVTADLFLELGEHFIRIEGRRRHVQFLIFFSHADLLDLISIDA